MSANEPGGLAEERRLFYVGITRARKRLLVSLATSRVGFGDVTVAMPSRFLQEIPADLIDWRQSPGGRGGFRQRSVGSSSRPGGGSIGSSGRFSYSDSLPPAPKKKTEWTTPVTGKVRDNGDLVLEVGDRVRHSDFGEGRVSGISGSGPKSIAEVQFESAGRKRLLIKIAPIEKL